MSGPDQEGSSQLQDEAESSELEDEEDDEDIHSEEEVEEEEEEHEVVDLDEIEQRVEVPKEIKTDSLIVDICCHPKRNLIACGTIKGPVSLHSFTNEEKGNQHILTYEHHKHPCRAVRFSDSGEYLFTAGGDKIINAIDMEKNTVFRKFTKEMDSSFYSILPIDNYLLASGDEDGEVVLWDFRMQAPIECFKDNEDYISSLSINAEKKILLATSGDGRLTSYNIRSKKLDIQSEDFDSDLLCSVICKGGTKVIVGTETGSLNFFNWGEFGNISDRFPGHPGSINTMSIISTNRDDVIFTGCEDGQIRVVQVYPHRYLGILGGHSGFSVERVSLTHDLALLASVSHDLKIKFWDLSMLEELKAQDVKAHNFKEKHINKPANDFFADL